MVDLNMRADRGEVIRQVAREGVARGSLHQRNHRRCREHGKISATGGDGRICLTDDAVSAAHYVDKCCGGGEVEMVRHASLLSGGARQQLSQALRSHV